LHFFRPLANCLVICQSISCRRVARANLFSAHASILTTRAECRGLSSPNRNLPQQLSCSLLLLASRDSRTLIRSERRVQLPCQRLGCSTTCSIEFRKLRTSCGTIVIAKRGVEAIRHTETCHLVGRHGIAGSIPAPATCELTWFRYRANAGSNPASCASNLRNCTILLALNTIRHCGLKPLGYRFSNVSRKAIPSSNTLPAFLQGGAWVGSGAATRALLGNELMALRYRWFNSIRPDLRADVVSLPLLTGRSWVRIPPVTSCR
jgi:hypothetical protein